MISASTKRDDGLESLLSSKTTPFVIHKKCRKDYTWASSIETFKRKRDGTISIPISDSVSCKLRSTIPSFDIKSECFYCAETILDYRKLPREHQNIPSEVATIEYLQWVLHRCDERADDWGTKVKLRIQNVNDLVAAEAKYHRKCSQLFALGRTQDIHPEKHTGRPVDQMKADAFEQLCHHINSNDECQYSFGELLDLYATFVGNGEGYTSKRLKQKLKEHYGDIVTITTSSGRPIIYSFCDIEHDILRDNWESARDPMTTSSNGNIFRVTGPLCGEFTGPGEFPTQRPVTRSFDVYFDLRLNKRLSKQPWGWWFETPS